MRIIFSFGRCYMPALTFSWWSALSCCRISIFRIPGTPLRRLEASWREWGLAALAIHAENQKKCCRGFPGGGQKPMYRGCQRTSHVDQMKPWKGGRVYPYFGRSSFPWRVPVARYLSFNVEYPVALSHFSWASVNLWSKMKRIYYQIWISVELLICHAFLPPNYINYPLKQFSLYSFFNNHYLDHLFSACFWALPNLCYAFGQEHNQNDHAAPS